MERIDRAAYRASVLLRPASHQQHYEEHPQDPRLVRKYVWDFKLSANAFRSSAFDVYVNGEYLPIILIETLAASTAPLVPGGPPRQLDIPLLDSLSARCMDVLYQEHHLRVYCVMITDLIPFPK